MNAENRLAVKAEIVQYKQVDMNILLDKFVHFVEVSSASVHMYNFGIKRFLCYLSENGITQPTRETVLMYKNALVEKKCKPTTIALYLSAIRRFFTWLESEGVYSNITRGVKAPKIDKGHRKDAFSGKQLRGILENMNRGTLQAKRNYAIMALISACGLRTVEVVRANVEDLRCVYGEYCLFIQGKGRTSKSEFVKVPEPVLAAIQDYLNARGQVEDNAPLFASLARRNYGQRLTTRTVSQVCKDAMKTAGYDSARLTAHSLRHSAVTMALMAGVSLQEVQAFARHSNLNTTMIYAHDVNRLKSQVEGKIAHELFAAA